MKVRPVARHDAPDWARMRTGLWPEAPADHGVEITDNFARPDESQAVFVSEEPDGALSGFLEAGMRPCAEGCLTSPVGYIEGWWVEPEHRGRGRGTALVKAAEDWARSCGLAEMASDAIQANELSQSAHRALGYAETARVVCFRKLLQSEGYADE